MRNGKRINVGLFVCHLENEFSSAVVNGAMIAAEKLDANLVVFPGRYINGVYNDAIRTEYEYQYNTIFSYASAKNLDVLLVTTGTIGGFITKKEMKAILDRYGDLPIITLASEIETYPCIKFDNTSGLIEGIEHIIHHHKRKNIAFVSGPSTNEDAQERLAVYAETMVKNGFKYDPKKIAYGDFSEYSYETVSELIRKNDNKLDAIIFANDKMAIGGYKAIVEAGLEIGRDISVMGFDDSIVSTSLSPNLTTVRADASELGYRAVIEGINLVKNGTMVNNIINTILVKRDSCGCKVFKSSDNNTLGNFGNITDLTPEQTAYAINNYLFDNFMLSTYTDEAKNAMFDFSLEFFKCAEKKDFSKDEEKLVVNKFNKVTATKILHSVSFEKFSNVLDAMCLKATKDFTEEEKVKFHIMFTSIYKSLTTISINERDSYKDRVHNIAWHTSSISRDVLAFANDDQNKYGDIIDKMQRLDLQSSYLFTFDEPFAYYNNSEWVLPENVYLRAYHNEQTAQVLPTEQQAVNVLDIFNNRYTPSDRRFTMVLNPLISQETHYGLLLTELERENFCFLSAITVQICAALKIIALLQDLETTQKQLEESLNEIRANNIILSKVSRTDELTGIFNRRGFFETAKAVISAPNNAGKHAALVFADMDGLKVINDMFGHDEGDFALKKVAYILEESFRSTDVVGRIGGDEFSAFAITNASNFTNTIKKRIHDISAMVNETSDKPYYIHVSVGVVEFDCEKGTDFQQLLDDADALLYEEKKNKKKVILKT